MSINSSNYSRSNSSSNRSNSNSSSARSSSNQTSTRKAEPVPTFKYAGVLPFSFGPTSGQLYFLLGQEQFKTDWKGSMLWSDFGGGREGTETPKEGAAREFYQESMGFWGSEAAILERLDDSKRVEVKNGYMYLLEIPYFPNEDQAGTTSLAAAYARVVQYFGACAREQQPPRGFKEIPTCPNGWYEKTHIRWFTARHLRRLALKEVGDFLLREEVSNSALELFKQYQVYTPPNGRPSELRRRE